MEKKGTKHQGLRRRGFGLGYYERANETRDLKKHTFFALSCYQDEKDTDDEIFILNSGVSPNLVRENLEKYMTDVEIMENETGIRIKSTKEVLHGFRLAR